MAAVTICSDFGQYERQKDLTLKDELPWLVGAQNATGEEWRNSSRKNDVTSGEDIARYSTEKNCIGTWNVRSMNQGKLDMVKQEMARVNINILGISELKWDRNGQV